MIIKEYYEHDKLIDLYVSRGLELENGFDNAPLFSYVLENNNEIIGAITCYKKDENYIIDAISIKEKYIRKNWGTKLLNKAIKNIRELGGVNIYLVAKKTSFFVKNNFTIIEREQAPDFSCCFTCPQYKVSCFPEVMKYKGDK